MVHNLVVAVGKCGGVSAHFEMYNAHQCRRSVPSKSTSVLTRLIPQQTRLPHQLGSVSSAQALVPHARQCTRGAGASKVRVYAQLEGNGCWR
jgi:hypothetical protein